MAKVLTGLCVLLLSSPAYANTITFLVGLPEHNTLVVGLPTAIPAALINTSDAPLEFGCLETWIARRFRSGASHDGYRNGCG